MKLNKSYFVAIFLIVIIIVSIYLGTKEENNNAEKPKPPPEPIIANWVAVGNDVSGNGNIMYSADGISWQESTGMSFADGYGVAYGTSDGTNPLWVAVGDYETGRRNIMYSANGISWQESTGMSFAEGYGVAYGTSNGTSPLWVAVGIDETERRNILYSTDGKEWQESTWEAFSFYGKGVAYGTSNGTSPLWVAVGNDGGYIAPGRGNIMYSADGISWQESTGMSFSRGNGVAYGTSDGTNPLWVAVGNDSGNNEPNRGNILYSTDGISWRESTGMSFAEGYGVAYGTSNGTSPLWVAVGFVGGNIVPDRGNIMYSADGISWQESTGMSFSGGYGIAYATSDGTNPLWVAVGYDETERRNILYSTDGKEWKESTGMSFSVSGRGVAYKSILPNVPKPPPEPIIANWVAVGNDDSGSGNIMYSADGISWQESTGTSFAIAGFGVAYGTSDGTNPLWVAVGDDQGGFSGPDRGNIMYSTDGISWQESTEGDFSNYGNGVAYGTSDGTNPLWVAVGNDKSTSGNIMYSADGKEWQESTGGGFSNYGNGVAYGTSDGTNPLWVAVGIDSENNALDRGNIVYSTDGISWQESTGMSFVEGNGVAYGTSNGTSPLWVAVGFVGDNKPTSGNIMYSADGKEWQESTGGDFSNYGSGVAYGTSNGTSPLWVAVGFGGGGTAPDRGNIMYSTDGISWQESTGMSFSGGYGIAYATSDGTNPLWVAVGYDETERRNILYSTDGKEWQESTGMSFYSTGRGVAYKSILPNVPNFY